MYIYIHIYVCENYIYKYTCMYTYICMYIYIYMYIYLYTWCIFGRTAGRATWPDWIYSGGLLRAQNRRRSKYFWVFITKIKQAKKAEVCCAFWMRQCKWHVLPLAVTYPTQTPHNLILLPFTQDLTPDPAVDMGGAEHARTSNTWRTDKNVLDCQGERGGERPHALG